MAATTSRSLQAPVPPSEQQLDVASRRLLKLSEGVEGSAAENTLAVFRRTDLSLIELWPEDHYEHMLDEVAVRVGGWWPDTVDPEGDTSRQLARNRLAIVQAIERRDLESELVYRGGRGDDLPLITAAQIEHYVTPAREASGITDDFAESEAMLRIANVIAAELSAIRSPHWRHAAETLRVALAETAADRPPRRFERIDGAS